MRCQVHTQEGTRVIVDDSLREWNRAVYRPMKAWPRADEKTDAGLEA